MDLSTGRPRKRRYDDITENRKTTEGKPEERRRKKKKKNIYDLRSSVLTFA
jgi:hypothetical protein